MNEACHTTDGASPRMRIGSLPAIKGVTRIVAVAFAGTALIVAAGLVGFVRLNATDGGEPAPAAVQAPVRETHDVAVLSVDFDRPIGPAGRGNREPSLLVAVDNRGTETEKGLAVVVRLTTENRAETTAKLVEHVSRLAPGEVKVVRFSGADLPLKSSYWLTVQVEPAQGEADFANNSKTLRIDGLAALGKD